jgi:hypothetical protein
MIDSNTNTNNNQDDDVYGGGGGGDAEGASSEPPPLPSPRVDTKDDEFTLIYEEDSMKRRDLLSSSVQSIDGTRFICTWITHRKTFKVRI